jgi:hypothetical protein
MTPAPDHEVIALREEILAAGTRNERASRLVGYLVVLPALLVLLSLGFLIFIPVERLPHVFTWLFGGIVLWMLFGILIIVVTSPVVLALLWRQQRKLLTRWRRLPPSERAAVLTGLGEVRSSDVKSLLQPLLRELRTSVRSELTPAATPPGRGDEASPADT